MGSHAYTPAGHLNKERIKEVVFRDSPHRAAFLSLVHGAAWADYRHWIARQPGGFYVIHEAALVFETHMGKTLDKVVLVTAPPDLCKRRVLQRDPSRSVDEIERIMERQWPEERKKGADFSIVNDGGRALIPQVMRIHEALIEGVG